MSKVEDVARSGGGGCAKERGLTGRVVVQGDDVERLHAATTKPKTRLSPTGTCHYSL